MVGSEYKSIVNLTPYKIVYKGGSTPYWFSRWDFSDVPSGKARKNEATYDMGLNFGHIRRHQRPPAPTRRSVRLARCRHEPHLGEFWLERAGDLEQHGDAESRPL